MGKAPTNWTPEELAEILPQLDAYNETPAKETLVRIKLFNPIGAGTWYLVSMDPETFVAFGFADLDDPMCAELGYIDITELFDLNLPLGLRIEKDEFWNIKNLAEIMYKVK